jgi:Ca2+-binding EF-hand superfamily protein
MSDIDQSTREALGKAGIGRDKLEEYATAFRLFDNDGTGLITVENLRYLLEDQFGEQLVCQVPP